MAFRFPAKSEIALARSPLAEVVCQVRFPIILKISQETPVEFQEQIRSRFPELSLERGLHLRAPTIGRQEDIAADIQPVVYRFSSADDLTTLSLAADFFAVTTTGYTHWRDFKHELDFAHQMVERVYQPARATRIGLRYINRLTLENTQTASALELIELLNPDLTATLRTDLFNTISGVAHQMTFSDGTVRLNLRVVYRIENDDPEIFLDLDAFEAGKLELASLMQRVEEFHTAIHDAFRWCLKDESLARFQHREGV